MTLLATDILKRVAIINNLTFKLELTNLSQNRIGCYDCCFVCASCLVALFRGFVVSNQICACTVSNKKIRAHALSAIKSVVDLRQAELEVKKGWFKTVMRLLLCKSLIELVY